MTDVNFFSILTMEGKSVLNALWYYLGLDVQFLGLLSRMVLWGLSNCSEDDPLGHLLLPLDIPR